MLAGVFDDLYTLTAKTTNSETQWEEKIKMVIDKLSSLVKGTKGDDLFFITFSKSRNLIKRKINLRNN